MGVMDDINAQIEEGNRQAAEREYRKRKSETQAGSRSYNEQELSALAQAGGVDVTPPASMPLPPDMTRASDRQAQGRRKRRGRSSTMLTSTLGEETLGG